MMKKIKLLVLAAGLFIQGCESEIPLFKDEDALISDEAVVVFNIYTTDSNIQTGWWLSTGLKNLYMNSTFDGKSLQKFSKFNHLEAKEVNKKYIVAKLPAGKYFLKQLNTVYSYSTGSYNYFVTLASPFYKSNATPLEFSVAAGEVKYLGDIEIKRATKTATKTDSSFITLYTIHKQLADAKNFLDQKYPSMSGRLREGLIQKTATQILIEQQYSAAGVSDVLKDVENAK